MSSTISITTRRNWNPDASPTKRIAVAIQIGSTNKCDQCGHGISRRTKFTRSYLPEAVAKCATEMMEDYSATGGRFLGIHFLLPLCVDCANSFRILKSNREAFFQRYVDEMLDELGKVDAKIKRREEKEANRIPKAIADLRKMMEFTR